MAEDYGHTGGGQYAGATPIKRVSWDIGTGAARTTGGTAPVSWDIGAGAARTTGPAPAPAPTYSSFSSQPAPYIAPVQGYQSQYSAPAQSAPAQQSIAQEAPRPQFAPGGRNEFMNIFSPEQQQVAQNQWLGGDSDYTAQVGMYQKALDDFVRRITGRIEGFRTDADQAIAGNQKNETMSADSLGADFGARGLSYSGLFDTSQNKLRNRYSEGRANIGKNRDTNIQNAEEERSNYEAENEISKQNALRSSLLRMAAQQQLADSNW